MKRSIVILAALIVQTSGLYAQFGFRHFQHTDRWEVGTSVDLSYNSNAITNRFAGQFIKGQFLDSTLISDVSSRLRSSNRFGGDLNYEIYGSAKLDTFLKQTDLSLVVGVGNHEHLDAIFPGQLFNLAFKGNKQFAGDTLDLGQINFNLLRYQRFRFGLMRTKWVDSVAYREGITLSVIKGEQNRVFYSPRSTFYTETDGKELDASMLYFTNQTDTNNVGFWEFNGIGASVGLFGEFPLAERGQINFRVEDIGFIYWNDKSIVRSADTSIYFDGIEVTNILNFNDSTFGEMTQDSLLGGIEGISKQRAYASPLPITFDVYYADSINEKWRYHVGLFHRLFVNYNPRIYTRIYYRPNDHFIIGGSLSYGGYGRLNSGFMIGNRIGKNVDLYLATNNLEGIILPRYTNGMSVQFRAHVHF